MRSILRWCCAGLFLSLAGCVGILVGYVILKFEQSPSAATDIRHAWSQIFGSATVAEVAPRERAGAADLLSATGDTARNAPIAIELANFQSTAQGAGSDAPQTLTPAPAAPAPATPAPATPAPATPAPATPAPATPVPATPVPPPPATPPKSLNNAPVIATINGIAVQPGVAVYLNSKSLAITGTMAGSASDLQTGQITVFVGSSSLTPLPGVATAATVASDGSWSVKSSQAIAGDGELNLTAAFTDSNHALLSPVSPRAVVKIRTTGPVPQDAQPTNLAQAGGKVYVRFDDPLNGRSISVKNFDLKGTDGKSIPPMAAKLYSDPTLVELTFTNVPPNEYTLSVYPPLTDAFGNSLAGTATSPLYTFPIVQLVGGDAPLLAPGISAGTGPYVPFSEFTPPRTEQNGFNPSDKVVTRVARLYYFRDAHRVAQIINRKARSYNRAAVDVAEQLADRSRGTADQATVARQAQERAAINAAQATRRAEHDLAVAQRQLAALQQSAQAAAKASAPTPATATATAGGTDAPGAAPTSQTSADTPPSPTSDTAQALAAARAAVQNLQQDVQVKREAELAATERAKASEATEDLARADQFRREVAAGHADPDTYVPGVPNSDDPVEQVSISVVGEGVIQLRGPIKGVNLCRTMINELDAPVGQVKVAVHTCQVNGERGDRMERVVGSMQRYIDHSRFLTTQSAEMLRRAVIKVASDKAVQVASQCPDRSQEFRDQRYLEAFFGQDFLDELRTLDSEFLKTGNKVLTLHSMDTTSLSSALFLMALAKNGTRMEILDEFTRLVDIELPAAEQEYFVAAGNSRAYGCKKFCFLAPNARFASIKGFFNADIQGDDTLSPIQREFIRLAQILKSRMVTELEWSQRVMERGMIEDRLGNYLQELQEAKDNDVAATKAADQFRGTRDTAAVDLILALAPINASADSATIALAQIGTISNQFQAIREQIVSVILDAADLPATVEHRYGLTGQPAAAPLRIAQEFRSKFDRPGAALPTGTELFEYQKNTYLPSLIDALGKNGDPKHAMRRLTDLQKSPYLKLRLSNPDRSSHVPDLSIPIDSDGLLSDEGIDAMANENVGNQDISARLAILQKQVRTSVEQAKTIENVIRKLNYFTPETQKDWNEAQRLLSDVINDMKANESKNVYWNLVRLSQAFAIYWDIVEAAQKQFSAISHVLAHIREDLKKDTDTSLEMAYRRWVGIRSDVSAALGQQLPDACAKTPEDPCSAVVTVNNRFTTMLAANFTFRLKVAAASRQRRPLDHKKFLDMLIDDTEDKFIELMEGTRAHTANMDAYLKRLATALDDDFNTQFYEPAFRGVRCASRYWDVNLGQIESTSILANNRTFAKVSPQATMEFDLPKRDIVINEAFKSAQAVYSDYGALIADPNFLALAKLYSGQPTSSSFAAGGPSPVVRDILPGLPSSSNEALLNQQGGAQPQFGAALEGLIPDPAVYKFETGTGFEVRPVIQPDGQSVVFHLNYMYTTNVREPVRADEKHLGRIKRHFIDTDVQTSNFELREVSRYRVALKASRTSRGVPLLEDAPGIGVLFRPLPQQQSSLQENLILAQTTIFPTMFDLMGLRWAPAVADLDALRLQESEFVVRGRKRNLQNRVYDYSSQQVDKFIRIPDAERRTDLYRSQETIPAVHPNGYNGPGLNLRDSQMREGYDPRMINPESQFAPGESKEGVPLIPLTPNASPLPAPPAGLPPVPMENGAARNGLSPQVDHEDDAAPVQPQSRRSTNRRPSGQVQGNTLNRMPAPFQPHPSAPARTKMVQPAGAEVEVDGESRSQRAAPLPVLQDETTTSTRPGLWRRKPPEAGSVKTAFHTSVPLAADAAQAAPSQSPATGIVTVRNEQEPPRKSWKPNWPGFKRAETRGKASGK